MKKVYRLKNLCCANCARKIEENVRKIDGVREATLVFMTMKLMLDVDESRSEQVLAEIRKVIGKYAPNCEILP